MNKTVKSLFIFMAMIFILFSCDNSGVTKTDKCKNIDCSGNGTCYIDHDYYIRCMCKEGYYEQGYNCVKYSCKEGYELNGTNCVKICQSCQGEDVYTSDPCENRNCSGHGFCRSDPDRTIYCNCYEGYKLQTGMQCVESECDAVSCAS